MTLVDREICKFTGALDPGGGTRNKDRVPGNSSKTEIMVIGAVLQPCRARP